MKINKILLAVASIIFIASFLRFYRLADVPPAPYWEEVALGYDAFSILKTGQDHHGNLWPIVAFESFGDWKPALYFYTIVPFIYLLGLSVEAVRLPSVLSGISIVIGVGFLAKLVMDKVNLNLKKKVNSTLLGLVAMGVTAISPWAILFSRAGWEVNLATALILWGMILGLKTKIIKASKNQTSLSLVYGLSSVLLLVLSTYAYHGTRVIAPLLGLSLFCWWLKDNPIIFLKKNLKQLSLMVLFGFLLFLPLISSLTKPELTQRFSETSIFSDISIIEESNKQKEALGNTFASRIIYHRYFLFSREIIKNFISHFDLNFLFLSGDQNPRHSTQYFGQLYHLELVFLMVGLYFVFKNKNSIFTILIFWLLVGIFPAAITKASPHALRILPTLPVFLILISLGIYQLYLWWLDFIRKQKITFLKQIYWLVIIAIYIVEFSTFWKFYTNIYPKVYAHEWQGGYEEMISSVNQAREVHQNLPVFITREQGRPAMYYWFFSKTDPTEVQSVQANSKKDQSEFLEFENIKFINTVNEVKSGSIVASSQEGFETAQELFPESKLDLIDQVKNDQGESIWVIFTIE